MKLRNYLISMGLVAILTLVWSMMEALYFSSYPHTFPDTTLSDTAFNTLMSLNFWCPWILLTPLILFIMQKTPFPRHRWPKALLIHLGISLGIGLIKSMLEILVMNIFSKQPIPMIKISFILYAAFFYWIFLAAYQGFLYFRRYQSNQIKLSIMEAKLTAAQLTSLKRTLQPHFLFNTLHAVSTLIHMDPKAANRMLAKLSELLRLTLESSELHEVTLSKELEFLKQYMEIVKIRFGPKLHFVVDTDPDAHSAYVPNLLLQPIVENAISHGIGDQESGGKVTLKTARDGGNLILSISDSGQGPPDQDILELGGIGLKNTKERLEQLYGPDGELVFSKSKEGGLKVRIKIPFHETPIKILSP